MADDPAPTKSSGKQFVPVCAIGASAGGVTALKSLFRQLPDNLGLAYVVILHLSPDHPSVLSEILGGCTSLPVHQIVDGPTLKPNCVYVIPPDRELVLEGDSVTARPFSEPRGRRAPIDMFFRSIAKGRGDGIAMVLSGSGSDGAMGVRAVKEAGGVIMVQDPAEAEFASMPQNAIVDGVADFVAPLARLAERVAEVAHSKEAVRSLDMDGGANELRRIVAFLRARTGHDFASYKRATVLRRVVRRMQVCRTDTLAGYADYLLATPEEAQELFSDLLISVTRFFRDPVAFDALARLAVKPLFDDLDGLPEAGLRAWVVGCATGEEAYSIAILLHEEAARRKVHPTIQIFASDLDEGALATAREGRYPRSIETDVSEERIDRFFIDEGTHYRVRKELRESVLFASHSAIKEPPFTRLDLVTCRNLLIYLERAMQHHLCAIFHYGLKPGRYLFLGSAETADSASDLFAPIDREARVYSSKPHTAHTLPILSSFGMPDRGGRSTNPAQSRATEQAEMPAALHAAALERAAPPSALVDRLQNVIHLSPTAGRFIQLSAGPLTTVLPLMVRPELRLDLGLALTRALETREPTLTHPVLVDFEGVGRRVCLQVTPTSDEERENVQALVLFLDGGSGTDGVEPEASPNTPPDEVRRLHAELRGAQEALVASRNSHQASIQDLSTTNEELQSINEEYRSTAEELETSKEELQSINEELHTVNAELKSKLESINLAHSNLQNLTAATEIGALFLDAELRIRMFTPPIEDLFNVTSRDIGRIVTDFTHRLQYQTLVENIRQVQSDLKTLEREVRDDDGRIHIMLIRPYRTVEDRISGTVITFVDITERIEIAAALRNSEERQAFLLRLSDALRPLDDPAEVQVVATRLLGERLGASRAYYLEFDTTNGRGTIERDYGAEGLPSIVGHYDYSTYEGIYRRISNGQTWTVKDASVDPELAVDERTLLLSQGIAAWIDVPLVKGGRLVAVLCVVQSKARAWSSPEIGLVEEVADRTWGAVERTRVQVALRESEAHLAAELESTTLLRQLADRLVTEGSPPAVYKKILSTAIAITAADAGTIQAFEPESNSLVLLATQGLGREMTEHFYRVDADSNTACGLALRTGERAFMEFDSNSNHDACIRHVAAGYRSAQATPLFSRTGKPIGMINTHWRSSKHRLDERQLRYLDLLARQAADLIERFWLDQQLRESEERLRQFGEASQDVLWIRDAETLQWTYLTPAFEEIYGLSREEVLVGDNCRSWLDLIVPEDRDQALENIKRVRAGEHVVFEFRLRRPSDGAVRWMRNTDFPILNLEGEVAAIGGIGSDITEVREAELRLKTLMEGIPQLVWRAVDGGEWTWASPQWTEFTGQEEADYRGWGWLMAIHPDDRDAAREAWSHAVERGGFQVEYRVERQGDGYRWFQTRASPVRDRAETIIEWLGTSTDIHDLRELQDRQKVLVAELQHRTRNLMGVIRSMSDKTARASTDLADFRRRFRDRLEALSRVQGLLSRLNDHDRVMFDELIRSELSAMSGDAERVSLDGPQGIRLRSSTVQTLAMALHELATNAVKYGALGQPGGRLAITWSLERQGGGDTPWLHIDWRESGVTMPPPGEAPRGTGQGRELIEKALPYQLSAKTSYTLGPDGAHCTIVIPVSASTMEIEEHA